MISQISLINSWKDGRKTIGVIPRVVEKGGRISNSVDVNIACDNLSDRKDLSPERLADYITRWHRYTSGNDFRQARKLQTIREMTFAMRGNSKPFGK